MIAGVTSDGMATMGMANMLAVTDTFWRFLGQMGGVLALGLAAVGSAAAIGIAGQAAAGAWAKEAKAGRNLSFTYIILVGMPISQTLYAMIVMSREPTRTRAITQPPARALMLRPAPVT